ncbi:Uncharacterised protein [Mycobacterium tuberculosis]|nr:Uncharacterised protein [Mycobacterium tuberculosis]COX16827.1 Uncharacterised protein [Mycobacterium tuberculosis]
MGHHHASGRAGGPGGVLQIRGRWILVFFEGIPIRSVQIEQINFDN